MNKKKRFFRIFLLIILSILTLLISISGVIFAESQMELAFKEVLIRSGVGDAALNSPNAVVEDSHANILLSDYDGKILKYDKNGLFQEVFLEAPAVGQPFDICIDDDDNLYVVDFGSASVVKFDSNGNQIGPVLGSPGRRDRTTEGNFYYPRGIGLDASGNIYVTDQLREDVQIFNSAGAFIGKIEVGHPAYGVATDINGDIYIAGNNIVCKYNISDLTTPIWSVATKSNAYSYGIKLLPDGKLLVSSINYSYLTLFDKDSGSVLDTYGVYGTSDSAVRSLKYFSLTSDGEILIVDRSNKRVQALTYAVPSVNLTYNGNSNDGGTTPATPVNVNKGSSVTLADNTGKLVKTGHTFKGWNTAENASGTHYDAGAIISIADDLALYAEWLANYSVTYNGNTHTGGTVVSDSRVYNKDNEVSVLGENNLVKTGYIFKGWNTAKDGSGIAYAEGETFSMGENDVTLYAQWKMIISTELKGLGVSGYTLNEPFDPNKNVYTVSDVTEGAVEVTALVEKGQYNSVRINDIRVTSGAAVKIDLVNGANTIDVTVTAQDGITFKIYSLIINKLSDTAHLKTFEVEGYDLTPSFNKNTTSYALHVTSGAAVTLLIEPEETGATMKFEANGDSQVTTSGATVILPIEVGLNTYNFKVTAENKIDQKTYSLFIDRDNDNAEPTNIEIVGQTLLPIFSGGVTDYQVGNTTNGTIAIGVTMDEYQRIQINGLSVKSGEIGNIPLAIGENTITISITAEDGLHTKQYTIHVIRYKENSGKTSGSGTSTSKKTEEGHLSNTSAPVSKTFEASKGVQVILNGKPEVAGIQTEQTIGGKKVVSVTMNHDIIKDKIAAAKVNSVSENILLVPISDTNSNIVEALLTGDIVKTMENDDFKLTIDVGNVQYTIPAKEVQISGVAEQLGVPMNRLENIVVEVQIESVAGSLEAQINKDAESRKYQIVSSPLEFKISATVEKSDGTKETIEIDHFNEYVDRLVKIPESVNPFDITTGVLYNSDGTFSHIPTTIVEIDGKYYAELHSMTNSCYSIIYNPIKVSSVSGYNYEGAVNNLASRLVIGNTEDFEANKAINRGEFIEYLVKALGLYKTNVKQNLYFSDMPTEYYDVIGIAKTYNIINGYPNGTIRGNNQITREEAIVMLDNVLNLLKIEEKGEGVFYEEMNEVSHWAVEAALRVSNSKILDSTTEILKDPKDMLTHGQAAVIIENLLKRAELINN